MKKSKKCPKCGGSEILRVEGHIGSHGAGNNIMLGKTIFSGIPVPRYICCDCGYAEEWVDSRDLYQLKDAMKKKK